MLADRVRMSSAIKLPVDITKTANAVNATALTTYTFSAVAFGAAAADRYIAVTVSIAFTTARTISSITIGGVGATVVVNGVAANYQRSAIAIAAVPTGTTGDIVITMSGGCDCCGIGVYRLTGLGSATPTQTASDIATPFEQSLTIPVNGGGIGYISVFSSTNRTFEWTNLTENFDQIIKTGSTTHSGALSLSAGTLTRTATPSGAVTQGILVLAAWGPK